MGEIISSIPNKLRLIDLSYVYNATVFLVKFREDLLCIL